MEKNWDKWEHVKYTSVKQSKIFEPLENVLKRLRVK